CLWAVAHGPIGDAVADEFGCRPLVDRLRARVSADLSRRSRSDGTDCSQRSCGGHRNRFEHRSGAPQGARARGFFPRGQRRRAMNQVLDFVPIWTAILGMAVFFYVLLDGFDLGVGMLYGFAPDARARNTIRDSIAPIWDGNETWLVMGGLGLLAAFPLAFAIIIPAVYFPILVMLLALVFRGVAFEFRFRDAEHKTFWDHAFS